MTTPAPDPVAPATGDAAYPPEVHVLEADGRRTVLVGTAHVSAASIELVRRVIEREKPDRVCVELDPRRFEALSQPQRWDSLDLKEIVRRQQLPTLLLHLVLAAYQKRIAGEIGVEPGSELLEATRVAAEHDIPVELCDRDVRVTLRRAAQRTSIWRRFVVLSELVGGLFDAPELSAAQIEELKRSDTLNELLQELGRSLPAIKEVLIDERDAYLAERIRQTPGSTVVAVVGAGHLEGIRAALAAGEPADLEALSVVPPPSPIWKLMGWGIPASIAAALAWIGWTQGREAAGEGALFWTLAHSLPSGIGAVLAFAHPATIATAVLTAPFTALTPVVGVGHTCAFVEAWVRPPLVRELRSAMDDAVVFRRWWSHRLLRVFLVFFLTSLGGTLGTLLGGAKIFSGLFE